MTRTIKLLIQSTLAAAILLAFSQTYQWAYARSVQPTTESVKSEILVTHGYIVDAPIDGFHSNGFWLNVKSHNEKSGRKTVCDIAVGETSQEVVVRCD